MTENFSPEELFFIIKKMALNLAAQLELNLKYNDITGVQVYFLVYILRHHPQGTYLTELYQEIGVSKATLSALIKKMTRKGYLDFQENPDDVRKKKVIPAKKLLDKEKEFILKADKLESDFFSVFDNEEKIQFRNLEKKLLMQFEIMGHN